jgi:hypothetical protein
LRNCLEELEMQNFFSAGAAHCFGTVGFILGCRPFQRDLLMLYKYSEFLLIINENAKFRRDSGTFSKKTMSFG